MRKLLKLLLVLLVVGAVASLVYWGGKKGMVLFRTAKEFRKSMVEKKRTPVNPKTDQKKSSEDQAGAVTGEKKDYTFFETLNDPEMKRIVGLDNRIQDAPLVAPRHVENKVVAKNEPDLMHGKKVVEASEEKLAEATQSKDPGPQKRDVGATRENIKKAPASMVSNGAVAHANPKAPAPDAAKGEDDKTYTVQISSFKDLARAQGLQAHLQKRGYPAYLLTIETPGKGGLVYRVFLGKYMGQNKAKAAASKVKREENIDAVVVLLSD